MKTWKENFRDYLRRYCNSRNILPEEAIKHKLVQEVREKYEKSGDVVITEVPNSGWTEYGCCK